MCNVLCMSRVATSGLAPHACDTCCVVRTAYVLNLLVLPPSPCLSCHTRSGFPQCSSYGTVDRLPVKFARQAKTNTLCVHFGYFALFTPFGPFLNVLLFVLYYFGFCQRYMCFLLVAAHRGKFFFHQKYFCSLVSGRAHAKVFA